MSILARLTRLPRTRAPRLRQRRLLPPKEPANKPVSLYAVSPDLLSHRSLDAFNAAFGITTDLASVTQIDNQGNAVAGTGAGGAAAAPAGDAAAAAPAAGAATPAAPAATPDCTVAAAAPVSTKYSGHVQCSSLTSGLCYQSCRRCCESYFQAL